MANEVMQTLFGLNSQSAADALRRQQRAEDLAYAQLDPRQQIIYNARQAGRSIGGGINQLFGLVPESLQRVRLIEGALAEAQPSDTALTNPEEFYSALIQSLQSKGLTREAAAVAMQAQNSLSEIGLKKAQTEKALAGDGAGKGEVSERNRRLVAKVNQALLRGEEVDPQELTEALQVFDVLLQPKFEMFNVPGTSEVRQIAVPGTGGKVDSIYPALSSMYKQIFTKPQHTAGATQPATPTLQPEELPAKVPVAAAEVSAAQQPVTYPLQSDVVHGTPLAPLDGYTGAQSAPPVAPPVAPVAPPVAAQSAGNIVVPPTAAQAEAMAQARRDKEFQLWMEKTRVDISKMGLELQKAEFDFKRSEKMTERTEKAQAKVDAFNSVIRAADDFVANAKAGLEQINWASTGLVGQVASLLWSSDSAQLSATLEALQSGVFMRAIMQLKQEGGGSTGLGQVTEREGERLVSMIRNLSQGQKPEVLKRNIIAVLEQYEVFKKEAEKRKKQIESEILSGGKEKPSLRPGDVVIVQGKRYRFIGGDSKVQANYKEIK